MKIVPTHKIFYLGILHPSKSTRMGSHFYYDHMGHTKSSTPMKDLPQHTQVEDTTEGAQTRFG
jgi:hypothetical protein